MNKQLLGVALICYSLSLFSCEYESKNLEYFDYSDSREIQVSMKIKTSCHQAQISKSKINQVTLIIKKQDNKTTRIVFEDGIWWASLKKFQLSNKVSNKETCLKNINYLNINLKDHYINSSDGMYLNLLDGNSYNWDC